MAVNGFEVFDGDGHVLENDDEIAQYFEGDFANLQRFKTFGVWPSLDGWARGFIMASNDGEPRRYTHTDAKVWGEMLEIIGAKGTVLYPTAGLAAGLISDPKWAVETIKAYNNWLEDRYTSKDERLYGAGIVPVQDPEAAAIEIARCATERVRFPAMMLPSQTYTGKTYGDEFFWPIFEAAEKHNMPLAIHGGPSRGMGFDHFREFVKVHTLEHPFPLMMQLTDIVFSGVWDAFPDYKKIHGIMKREQEDAEFDYGKDDDKKEKVQKKMTKGLVQTAVDSEYWTRTGSDADNTTAIVLFFQ